MSGDDPFEGRAEEYDAWYDRHEAAYRSELRAVRTLMGSPGRALEVGVGTGRFAAPLGIGYGVDPAAGVLRRARDRGVSVARGVGERLPIRSNSCDRVLINLTLCFLDSPGRALAEVARVLRPRGRLVVGFLDPTSPPGREYAASRRGPFYREAVFRTPEEVDGLLTSSGFAVGRILQCVTRPPEEMAEPERPREGRGDGIFVVVEALPERRAAHP